MSTPRNRTAWTHAKASRFIYRSLASLRPKKLIIDTLVREGISPAKAEKLYEEALVSLSPNDNAVLRSSIAYSISNLLETIEDAIEQAIVRGDWISHTQLLKLKQRTLADYAGQFTTKDGDVDKQTTDQEAILRLAAIFGDRD
jgi:hypothetical protein